MANILVLGAAGGLGYVMDSLSADWSTGTRFLFYRASPS
jgi:hypothetical protein